MAFRFPTLLAASLLLAAPALPVRAAEEGIVQHAALAPDALTREAGFAHTVVRPQRPSGRVLILMHGSGGDETTLIDLASRIAPDATLIGIRGRVVQDGVKRWYRRVTPTEFDQQDVRAEADAFVGFLRRLAQEREFDLAGATFLGYSNGANLIAALTQLYPDLVREAVLLRPMPVLAETARVDLSQTRVLTIAGEKDTFYFPFADELEALLEGCGAAVDARTVPSGHGIGAEDIRIAAEWLGSREKQPDISATESAESVLSFAPETDGHEGEER